MRGQKLEILALERRLASALRRDVDCLAVNFCENKTPQLFVFAELFNKKEFSTIFLGRLAISELIEFSENLLIHCARFMYSEVKNDRNSHDYPSYVIGNEPNKGYDLVYSKINAEKTTMMRIFGIFMCYSLYFLQPAQFVSPIRVSLNQMNNLYKFLNEVLMVEKHFEAIYCLLRLIDNNAFSITPFETDFNAFTLRRFDTFESDDIKFEVIDFENYKDFFLLTELSEDITLKQISAIHECYKNMKANCNLPNISKETSTTSTDFCEFVQNLLDQTKKSLEKPESKESTLTRRSRIKEAAYTSVASDPYHTKRKIHKLNEK